MPSGALNLCVSFALGFSHPHSRQMPPRLSAVAAACVIAAVACAKQPPAQTTSLDTSKPAVDSSLARADKARIQGSENAKIWMVIASDFQCPFCKQFHDDAYKRILNDYVVPGKIRVAFLNHPGSMHQYAVVSAEAAMCAGMQDRFWQMHDSLFASQDRWAQSENPVSTFDSLAAHLQLRMPDWRACMSTHKTRPMIDADHARSTASGVNGTPSFFIANKLAVVGAQPYADFKAALDSALAHAGPPATNR
jgi:protein-disulfide isomerase